MSVQGHSFPSPYWCNIQVGSGFTCSTTDMLCCTFCLASCLFQPGLHRPCACFSSEFTAILILWAHFLQDVLVHRPTFHCQVHFVCLRNAFLPAHGLGHFAKRCCLGHNLTCNQDEAECHFTKEVLKVETIKKTYLLDQRTWAFWILLSLFKQQNLDIPELWKK